MNREVLRTMETQHIPIERLISLLQTFALKHAARALPDLLETADTQNATNRQLLLSVLETEVKGRNERRRKRNYSAAHFPRMSVRSGNSIRKNWNPVFHRHSWTG